jgi:hypothetical protein
MRERGTLLTSPDWKTMYEAQERDMAALRKRVGELEADLATAGSNVHTLRDELREAQQQMAADAMLIAEAQRGAEIVADTERRLPKRRCHGRSRIRHGGSCGTPKPTSCARPPTPTGTTRLTRHGAGRYDNERMERPLKRGRRRMGFYGST